MKSIRPSKQNELLEMMQGKTLVKRLTVEVDEDFHTKVKEYVAKNRISMKKLIQESVGKFINLQ